MPQKIPFHVIHASGQDENYRAAELNTHSPLTRGWQSSRFCLYPQDIVVQMEKRCRIRKVQLLSHQYLIASRAEFYVGDIPPDMSVSLQNARYTRLGYVALSDNEQTDYKARELKSVHVDAVGVFLKIVIHKNHVNKHNLYNQVGIIAINVIGDDINYSNQANIEIGPTIPVPQKPDYISPLDDLAFDMYQDPEVAQIIRKLERKKQEAVLQERYDFAKRLKQAIAELQKIGERLGKYEVEKRQAVESEDYDKAKLKKVQMEEYRLQMYKQLEIHDLLELNSSQKKETTPRREAPPTRLKEIPSPPLPPATEVIRSMPAQSPLPQLPSSGGSQSLPAEVTPAPADAADEKQLPAPQEFDHDEEASAADNHTNVSVSAPSNIEPDQMTEKDVREAAWVIDVFALPLVQKAYTRNWAIKEECAADLLTFMSEFSGDREEARTTLKAAIFIIQRLLRDSVFAVFRAGLTALKFVLTNFIPKHKIPKGDVSYTVDKCLPELQHRGGDTAARTRLEAKAFILEMAHFTELKASNIVPLTCVRVFSLNITPRLALSHVETIDALYTQLGAAESGLTVDDMMKFCVNALQHPAGQVRTLTESLVIKLYKQHGSIVKSYLPADDDKTRKRTLYRQLFEAFDQLDGKPTKRDIEKQKQNDVTAKKAEVEALQLQIAQMKALHSNVAKDKKVAPGKRLDSTPVKKSTLGSLAAEDDSISNITKFDRTCIFCNEQNDEFTEEGLDLHYWKSCPMLKRCQNCKQVVEIAGLTEHLLTECEAKNTYSKCPRCTEAVLKSEFDEHVKSKACNPADPKKARCPLCHLNIPNADTAWTEHLITSTDGCKQNPRRLAAQNKAKTKARPSIAPKSVPGKAIPKLQQRR